MDSEDDNKPIAVLITCMDRRFNEMIDDRIDYYKSMGYQVIVFRTAGGNIDPIENELRELAARSGPRLEVVEAAAHIDCAWVKRSAQVLYFGAEASGDVRAEMARVFEGLEVTEQDKADLLRLHAKMEVRNADYLGRRLEDIVGKEVRKEIRRPDARIYDKERGQEHDHYLVFVAPSDTKTQELIDALENAGISGIAPLQMYQLRGDAKNLLPASEVAVGPLKLGEHKVFIFGKDDAGWADRTKSVLESSPFMKDVNMSIIKLNGKAKMPLAAA